MTVTIKIQQKVFLNEIEGLYKELYLNQSGDIRINLLYTPTKSKRYFGLSAAVVQFVASWLRLSNSGDFTLNTQDLSKENIEEMYRKDEALFAILSLVFKEKSVLGTFDKISINDLLKPFQNEYYLSMIKVDNVSNNNLVCVTYDYLFSHPVFEKNGRFVPSPFDVADSLKLPIVESILKQSKEMQRVFLNEQESFFAIIYELMKNTYEWGRTDETGVAFNPSLRGLIVKFFKKERMKFTEEYASLPFVAEYFDSPVLKENDKGDLYFLEISVFDTGAGFIKKYKSSNQNIDTIADVDIIKRCLIKHNTSSTGINKGNKGIGLDRILKTIDKKGFLRIRTDKYALYRNMIKDEYIEANNEVDVNLYDWISQSNSSFTPMEEVSGSVISIIFPLAIQIGNE